MSAFTCRVLSNATLQWVTKMLFMSAGRTIHVP